MHGLMEEVADGRQEATATLHYVTSLNHVKKDLRSIREERFFEHRVHNQSNKERGGTEVTCNKRGIEPSNNEEAARGKHRYS